MKRTYLSKLSPEIITKRLQDGDTIMYLGKPCAKLVNGIIIKYSSSQNCFLINGEMFINSSNDYYFEDPEPITEPGIYRLKNGKKAFICSVKPHILFGAVEDSATINRWNPNGGAYMNDVLDKDHEIVGKWEEK